MVIPQANSGINEPSELQKRAKVLVRGLRADYRADPILHDASSAVNGSVWGTNESIVHVKFGLSKSMSVDSSL